VFGIFILIAPDWLSAQLNMPKPDQVVFGVVGSTYLAFGIVSLLGIRSPPRFVPVLFLQLIYKLVWLFSVWLPLAFGSQPPPYAWLFAVVFVSYVVGDLIAIPFSYLWSEERVDV
jgi:hypothetical protein